MNSEDMGLIIAFIGVVVVAVGLVLVIRRRKGKRTNPLHSGPVDPFGPVNAYRTREEREEADRRARWLADKANDGKAPYWLQSAPPKKPDPPKTEAPKTEPPDKTA